MWKYRPLDEDRFSMYQWGFHYLGISRIVYNPEWKRWKIKANGYNPLLWILLGFVAPFAPLFTPKTLKEAWYDLWNLDHEFVWELYAKKEDGSYKYISYDEVIREGQPAK